MSFCLLFKNEVQRTTTLPGGSALENGAQRKVFGSEGEEVTGDGRKLRREEVVGYNVCQK